jgi:hypothetical protein
MRNGSKTCPFCASRFTFEEFELVDSMPAEEPCEGCVRHYAVLAESAKRKAEMKAQEGETAEPVDLSSPTAILSRLLAGRRQASAPVHDHAKAAAGDHD